MRFPPTMERLYSDQVRQRQALADIDRLLVICDRQIVAAIAPGHRPQVVQGVGHMPLIVCGARDRERFVQAGDGLLVGIGAPIRHAKLDQHITRMRMITQRVCRIDHQLKVSHRALDLAGLRPRQTTPLVQGKFLRLGCGLRMRLQ